MIKPAALTLAVCAIATPAGASSHYWNTYASSFEPSCRQSYQGDFNGYCYCVRNYYNTVFGNFCNNYGCGENYPVDEYTPHAKAASGALQNVNNHIRSQGCN